MRIFNDPLQQQAFNLLNPTSSANNLSLLQQADAIREQNALDTLAQQQRSQEELVKQKRSPREGFINFLDLLSDTGLRFQGKDPATYKATQKELLLELEDKNRQREQQIQTQETLKQYLNPQQYALYAAGVPFSAIAEFTTKDLSGQQIIENVEQNVERTIEQTGITDSFANLDEAFGPIDAAQEALSKATRIFGFDVESETGAAIRARNSLNTEILANLAADFTGKPNLLIYEELKGNLPTTAATSEKDAREKYINIKNQVDARINNLKQGILSSSLSDSDREKYREELNKSSLLSKKLDSAILSLKGKSKNILEPDSNPSSVDFSNLYLE